MSDTNDWDRSGERDRPRDQQSGIIVSGGGGRRVPSGRGCLFWMMVGVSLSVTLTVLASLVLFLFSGGESRVGVWLRARFEARGRDVRLG